MQIILLEKVANLGNLGDVVKVKVLEVDQSRQRISLTMKLDVAVPAVSSSKSNNLGSGNGQKFQPRAHQPSISGNNKVATAMEAAFAKFKK